MSFNLFPYTDLHKLNLNWIIKIVKVCSDVVSQANDNIQTALHNAAEALQASQAAANLATNASYKVNLMEPKVEALEQDQIQMAADMERMAGRVAATVLFDPQELTANQQTQARSNIGAGSAQDVEDNATDIQQLQTSAVSTTARLNALEAELPATYVSSQVVQSFTSAEQARARSNIGAISADEVPAPEGAVLYNAAQQLSYLQRTQARDNIKAAAMETLEIRIHYPADISGNNSTDFTHPTAQDIEAALSTYGHVAIKLYIEGDGQGVIDTIVHAYPAVAMDQAMQGVVTLTFMVATNYAFMVISDLPNVGSYYTVKPL